MLSVVDHCIDDMASVLATALQHLPREQGLQRHATFLMNDANGRLCGGLICNDEFLRLHGGDVACANPKAISATVGAARICVGAIQEDAGGACSIAIDTWDHGWFQAAVLTAEDLASGIELPTGPYKGCSVTLDPTLSPALLEGMVTNVPGRQLM